MSTPGGYITDRTCPANPAHGKVWDLDGGHHCSHSDHHKPLTQSFWTDDEFQQAKSLPTPQPNHNVAIPKTKKARRRR